jgi:hypothetical protein
MEASRARSTPRSASGRKATGLAVACSNQARVPQSPKATPPAVDAARPRSSRRRRKYVA